MTVLTRPELIGSITDLRAALDRARAAARSRVRGDGHAGRVVLVPTMGALHAGHLSLVRRARALGDIVVVSIFVNPLQFGVGEDLDAYPRTVEADMALLADLGVDYVFVPTATEMYPAGAGETRVVAGPVGSLLEGAARPGHFDGMLTVVSKLINIVGPDTVMFGQKDAQQVFLVQSMIADLNVRVAIEVAPIVREPSGLALSSRNRYLAADEVEAAVTLSAGLAAASVAAALGTADAAAAIETARAIIAARPLVKLDYLVVVHPQTFLPVEAQYHGPARMLVAALVGHTRLIDNVPLDLNPTARPEARPEARSTAQEI
ncbi:pantoate--beta-alanine ligase [Cryobacterium melibiosiphilum]|uniref:Pantothenate synthetase n=1 Tax=Cryobacterium melibiosiphilum TaxID=995039 RepID=A0A3A5ME33_9MICO|nr:pantoate--beta-alanine ligase [Cryobacterium melibiosiphilum]RJT85102.1 pantoate--beta-alanine ligase [Cryobacterium melibiosiphilum]